MSSKSEKFKALMSSPSGSVKSKQEIFETEFEVKPEEKVTKKRVKKKVTFEFEPELHRWLKMHAVSQGKDMVSIVESVLREYRRGCVD